MDSFPKCNFYSINISLNPIVAMLFKQQGRRIGREWIGATIFCRKSIILLNPLVTMFCLHLKVDLGWTHYLKVHDLCISECLIKKVIWFKMKLFLLQLEFQGKPIQIYMQNGAEKEWRKTFILCFYNLSATPLIMKNAINTIICLASIWQTCSYSRLFKALSFSAF